MLLGRRLLDFPENEWKRQRVPQRLREKLLDTRTSKETVTARIFLDYGGFKTWIAYFLATKGQVHFEGRHSRTSTIAEFQELSVDDRINTARRVTGVKPHPATDDAIQKISDSLIRDRSHLTILLSFR
jgi:hypothetical protein